MQEPQFVWIGIEKAMVETHHHGLSGKLRLVPDHVTNIHFFLALPLLEMNVLT